MKTNWKRILMLLCAAVVSVSFTGGCKKSAKDNDPTESPTESPAPSEDNGSGNGGQVGGGFVFAEWDNDADGAGETAGLPFKFTLDEAAKTSAGVFLADGTLVRTLWGGVDYGAGTPRGQMGRQGRRGQHTARRRL